MSTVVPSSLVRVGSAPRSTSTRMRGASASRAAISSGVAPTRFEGVAVAVPRLGRHAGVHVGPALDEGAGEGQAVQGAGGHRPRRVEAEVRHPHPGHRVQGGPSLVGPVGVGAEVDQKHPQLPVGVGRGQHHGVHAVGQLVVGVGAGRDEPADGLDVAGSHREEQGAEAVGGGALQPGAEGGLGHHGARVDVGSRVDEGLQGFDVALGRRPHQRGLARPLGRVHVGAVGDEGAHGVGPPSPRRRQQGGLAAGPRALGSTPARSSVSSIAAEPLTAASARGVTPKALAAPASAPASSRRPATPGRSSRAAQCSAVAPSRCRPVHVGAVREQRPHGGGVSVPDRVQQRRIGRCAGGWPCGQQVDEKAGRGEPARCGRTGASSAKRHGVLLGRCAYPTAIAVTFRSTRGRTRLSIEDYHRG